MSRCMYQDSLSGFLQSAPESILGKIVAAFHGNVQTASISAWEGEVQILQRALEEWSQEDASIFFEYDIPRLGKRIDVVLLLKGIVFCLEFKVGQSNALQSDVEQVLDYALDLKNFHRYSFDRPIAPILIPSRCGKMNCRLEASAYHDQILNPLIVNADGLPDLLRRVVKQFSCEVHPEQWGNKWLISPYLPTPTIIEAAKTLYEHHSVEDITKHEADKVSTDATIRYVLDVITASKERNHKSICFVTGVPGAGKTLVGLDIAVKQTYRGGKQSKEDGAVYLSGNGPLVAVLTEALARDNKQKCDAKGSKKNISDARREVSEFLQMIHRYRDNMLAKIENPVVNGQLRIDPNKAVQQGEAGYGEWEHVAIFDEAQRAWTHKRLAAYLKKGGTYGNKLKVPNFPVSEAAFLIWSLDHHQDWAVIVCLVGGGQEINTGEAGIGEWINAVNAYYPDWHIHISSQLTAKEYAEGKVAELLQHSRHVTFSDQLHLAVNQRSFRAERLSDFVHALLNFDPNAANLYREVISNGYTVYVTRNITAARNWLHQNARGSSQTGILVSKVAARFKPHAVHILAPGDQNAIHWFLEDKNDVRSSNYLEEAATEIRVQGLELDFVCVLWDADMRATSQNTWDYYKFNGQTKWIPENNPETRKYMLNAYRVLLTRARQGLVICIPEGNKNKNPEGYWEDATRLEEFYKPTYDYFKQIGMEELPLG